MRSLARVRECTANLVAEREQARWRNFSAAMVKFTEMDRDIVVLAPAGQSVPDLDDRMGLKWDEDEVAQFRRSSVNRAGPSHRCA